MRIANYLRPDCVALRQRADSLTGAVQQMVTLLDGTDNLTDTAEFAADVRARLALGGVCVGNGLAIPHANRTAVRPLQLAALPLARRRLGSRRDLRTLIRLVLVCTVALAVVDCQMAGMLYRYQSDWLGPLLLAAALAWLFAESVLQARPIPALTKALRTALPLAVLAGVCYNFCVYFAAEPQLMGQNPALYENVSRLVQFWL